MFMILKLWVFFNFILFLLTIKHNVCSDKLQQDNKSTNLKSLFKVFRIFPKTWTDITSLTKLRSISEENKIDFWLDSRQPNYFADVMVSHDALKFFEQFMVDHKLNYKETVSDVEKLIYKNEAATWNSHDKNFKNNKQRLNFQWSNISHLKFDKIHKDNDFRLQSFLRRLHDEHSTEFDSENQKLFEKIGELRASYPFGVYTNYALMMRYMRTLDFYYPHIVKLISIGKTHEGRLIEGLQIGYNVGNKKKRVFWIDGNIHAREWASSHTALFIINQLVSGYGKNSEITHYVNSLDFIIVPCANPDGYEYSRSSLKPQVRLWRKNRSPKLCVQSLWGEKRCCQGVDLNRNFDFHWAETGSSFNPCSNLYAGSEPLSEPETKAVADFLNSKEMRDRVDGFITLHTYAQMWIHPFSHKLKYYSKDYTIIKNVAEKATSRIQSIYGTKYHVGTGADLLAPASGGSDDWAKDKLGIKFVYLVELRPQHNRLLNFI